MTPIGWFCCRYTHTIFLSGYFPDVHHGSLLGLPGHVSHDAQTDEPLRRAFGCGRGTGGLLLCAGTLLYHVPLADAGPSELNVVPVGHKIHGKNRGTPQP